MTDDDDVYAEGLEAIRALKARLARMEELAKAAAQPPALTDRTPDFSAAIRKLAAEGTASGSAVDSLRRQITERPEPATAPSRDALAEAARVVTDGLRGAGSIEEAFSNMKARQARLDGLESADPGSSGRVDPSDPTATTAADRLRRALSKEH